MFPPAPDFEGSSLEQLLGTLPVEVAGILIRALEGHEITLEDAVALFDAPDRELPAMLMVADELRRRTVGDMVTYVVNRNINFTNVCIKRCGFCAFSRDYREEEGYFLPLEEIVRRAKEAWEFGATEVCIQAGLPPQMEGDFYVRICRAVKEAVPGIHLHSFSPEEVLYGAVRSRMTIREHLRELQAAGLGSLPGTAAEILDDRLRDRISRGRIATAQWIDVITTAHELGIPTTSTMMYGHIETHADLARHLNLLRQIQRRSGGFTEFVPLSFVHTEAPMYRLGLVPGIRSGPTRAEVLKVHAISRIMLNQAIPNLQVSWVKEGLRFAQVLLRAGVNDFGGTLINESISTSAGAAHGQLVRPVDFRRVIREAGRIPAERTTTYRIRRLFEDGEETADPLDTVGDRCEERFGSYVRLTKTGRFRYQHPHRAADPGPAR
jgi:7,8-didemethyl-8-hydroxy-5-deazariboflavin synthase CofH subunit